MKKSELKKLISDYISLKQKPNKNHSEEISDKLKEIEHRYSHETGRNIESDLEEKSSKTHKGADYFTESGASDRLF